MYNNPDSHEKKNWWLRLFIVIIVCLACGLVISGFYLNTAHKRYHRIYTLQATQLAESVAVFFPVDLFTDWAKTTDDQPNAHYDEIREKLLTLTETNDLVYYAFLIGQLDGEMTLLVDSRPDQTTYFSPFDNLNEQIADDDWIPFVSEESILTKPIENQWGSWIRALVPIKDATSGQQIAILGLSFSTSDWNKNIAKRMRDDIIVVICLFVFLAAIGHTVFVLNRLQKKSRQLLVDKELYHNLFAQSPLGVIINEYKKGSLSSRMVDANPLVSKIIGYSPAELADINWMDLTADDSLPKEIELFERFRNRQTDGYSLEKQLRRPDGSIIWVNCKVASFIGRKDSEFTYLCMLEDITERKKIENSLRESERSKSVLLSHLPGMAYRARFDQNWTMEFISAGCLQLTGYRPEHLLYNCDVAFNDIIAPAYRELVRNTLTRDIRLGRSYRVEYEIIKKSGESKWVLEMGQGIVDQDGQVHALEGIIFDMSEQKKLDLRVSYLSKHDFLTGLYNRNYLEQEKISLDHESSLPLSVIICDINGLRLINDAFGYDHGDRLISETAQLLQNICRPQDILGRVGGGEFHLLMPNTSAEQVKAKVGLIENTIDSYNRSRQRPLYEISLTIGYATAKKPGTAFVDTLKIAEGYLKQRKLLNQKSQHYSILSSILSTLYAKSQETEKHGRRLEHYTMLIGEELGLALNVLDDLRLLSMLHDIGKIGIDDGILKKPGELTPQEWLEMQEHPEIGYRIAMSTPELEHIADYILHHHERWDGTGYPHSLSGQDITLPARILAIADSYDAMTQERVYRRAMSPKEALKEIRDNAGVLFDPDIAGVFVQIMQDSPDLHLD